MFCPEDGGPYVLKPRFFGSRAQWELYPTHDGFCLERVGDAVTVFGRFEGKDYAVTFENGVAHFSGEGFVVSCDELDPTQELSGKADREIDLTYVRLMSLLRHAVLESASVNYVNA